MQTAPGLVGGFSLGDWLISALVCLVAGRGVAGRRRDRRHAHPGEMVPGHGGPLPQLAQHHARARRARRLLHAPGQSHPHIQQQIAKNSLWKQTCFGPCGLYPFVSLHTNLILLGLVINGTDTNSGSERHKPIEVSIHFHRRLHGTDRIWYRDFTENGREAFACAVQLNDWGYWKSNLGEVEKVCSALVTLLELLVSMVIAAIV